MRYTPLLFLTLIGCPDKAPPTAAAASTPAWPSEPVTLRFVALNDFHGALYEQTVRGMEGPADAPQVLGGLPFVVGAVDALRAEHPDLIVLDGGDQFQGTWPVNATQGRGSVQAFNLLRVDAAAVGNHEFDYGGVPDGHPLRGALEAGGKLADFAWLAANITHEDGTPWAPEGFAPWTIIERQGVRVGVIGLSTEDTPQVTLAANVSDLRFHDVVATMQATVPQVRAAGAQVIAVVGHLTGACAPSSYDDAPESCLPSAEIGRLLTDLPRGTIDVLVLGHAHTIMAHRWDDTFVLEQRAQGHALGIVDLVVGPNGVEPDASTVHPPWFLAHAPVDPGCEPGEYDLTPRDVNGRTVTPSADALALVRALEAEAGSLCDPVGCSTAPLGRSRTYESAVGNVVADAMLAAFPDADLAITNSGGLRADLPGGTLRREHWQQVMPFDNRTLLVEITGERLELLLRLGSSGAHGIMQIAGATYGFDPKATAGSDLDGDGSVAAWETDRLCRSQVTIGGAPLEPKRTYKLVTTDFLVGGGDHLGPAFVDATVLREGPLLRDHLFVWSAAQSGCIGAAAPPVDKRAPRIRQGTCGR